MRIIGNIDHPQLKISVFESGDRFPVQFEDGQNAIICKLRRGDGLERLEDVKKWVDANFCAAIAQQLVALGQLQQKQLKHFSSINSGGLDDLPTII